jgi:hypothetical protein
MGQRLEWVNASNLSSERLRRLALDGDAIVIRTAVIGAPFSSLSITDALVDVAVTAFRLFDDGVAIRDWATS